MSDKERLENMSPIGFDLDGNVLLKGEDYHWLMERVQELEEKVENYKTVNKELHQRGRKVRKQNKRYRESLEEIKSHQVVGMANWGIEYAKLQKIARQALEG